MEYLSTAQLGSIIGISASTVLKYANINKIEPSKIEDWKYGERYFWDAKTADLLSPLVPRRTLSTDPKNIKARAYRLANREKIAAAAAEEEAKRVEEARIAKDVALEHYIRHQIAKATFEHLTGAPLLERALLCLHALNRAVKYLYEKRDIYALKNKFLLALLRGKKATLYSYQWEQEVAITFCEDCDHEWYGRNDQCYGCGEEMGFETETKTWFIVESGTYRFHCPPEYMPKLLADTAIPTEPHDPEQGKKEVPDLGLSIEVQKQIVEKCVLELIETETTESKAT